ncbi:hypothetical protein TYRP_011801 [Tyrophagus putrescentiae]|nr:hypothetical protein TYRP_011801 [Tyrophagus putrescentiae]
MTIEVCGCSLLCLNTKKLCLNSIIIIFIIIITQAFVVIPHDFSFEVLIAGSNAKKILEHTLEEEEVIGTELRICYSCPAKRIERRRQWLWSLGDFTCFNSFQSVYWFTTTTRTTTTKLKKLEREKKVVHLQHHPHLLRFK